MILVSGLAAASLLLWPSAHGQVSISATRWREPSVCLFPAAGWEQRSQELARAI